MGGIELRLPSPKLPHISPFWWWAALGAFLLTEHENYVNGTEHMTSAEAAGLMRTMTGAAPSEGRFRRVLSVPTGWTIGTGPVPVSAEVHTYVGE